MPDAYLHRPSQSANLGTSCRFFATRHLLHSLIELALALRFSELFLAFLHLVLSPRVVAYHALVHILRASVSGQPHGGRYEGRTSRSVSCIWCTPHTVSVVSTTLARSVAFALADMEAS
jgi:hypothetical protein